MEVSGQLHPAAVLLPEQTGKELGWALEPYWMQW